MNPEITAPSVPRGKRLNGAPRLGEMEMAALAMNGAHSMMTDLVLTSDVCKVEICSKCKTQKLNCTCEFYPTKMITRKSLMAIDTLNSLYTRIRSLRAGGVQLTSTTTQVAMTFSSESRSL